jgi:hypothetical protein
MSSSSLLVGNERWKKKKRKSFRSSDESNKGRMKERRGNQSDGMVDKFNLWFNFSFRRLLVARCSRCTDDRTARGDLFHHMTKKPHRCCRTSSEWIDVVILNVAFYTQWERMKVKEVAVTPSRRVQKGGIRTEIR